MNRAMKKIFNTHSDDFNSQHGKIYDNMDIVGDLSRFSRELSTHARDGHLIDLIKL